MLGLKWKDVGLMSLGQSITRHYQLTLKDLCLYTVSGICISLYVGRMNRVVIL